MALGRLLQHFRRASLPRQRCTFSRGHLASVQLSTAEQPFSAEFFERSMKVKDEAYAQLVDRLLDVKDDSNAKLMKLAVDNMRLQNTLRIAHTKLLFAKGLLNMRGVMECFEALMEPMYGDAVEARLRVRKVASTKVQRKQGPNAKSKDDRAMVEVVGKDIPEEGTRHSTAGDANVVGGVSRRVTLWEVVLEDSLGLQMAIVEVTGWRKKHIPKMMDIMYTSLSNQIHEEVGVDGSAVKIVVGVLGRKECYALKCVCEAYPLDCIVIDN